MEEFIEDEDKDEEQQEAEETKAELNKKLINEMKKNRKHSQSRLRNISLRRETFQLDINKHISVEHKCREYVTPPFYEKIY